jgi:uncharacterized protein YuzB (UPF0349 family)
MQHRNLVKTTNHDRKKIKKSHEEEIMEYGCKALSGI